MSLFTNDGARPMGKGEQCPAGSVTDSELAAMLRGYKRSVASRYRSVVQEELATHLPPGKLLVSPKIDGELWFLVLDGAQAFFASPKGRVITGDVPVLKEALKALKRSEGRTIIAGELFAIKGKGSKGRPRVGDLANAMGGGEKAATDRIAFAAFDSLMGNQPETAAAPELFEGTEVPTDDASSDSDTTETTDTTDTDTGPNCNGEGELGPVRKLIWIANSGQGTVSKIDTETGVELGRYIVRADSAGSPSRTSVNRFGDVAVANRLGGVAKVYASEDDCVDQNGVQGIQTSTGANDVLPWGQDECLAWFTDLPHGDNRPMAWTNGVFNDETCEWEDVNVWTAWSDWAPGTAVVALLDGTDGSIIQEVPIPDLPNPWPNWHGFYGAAVDSDNNVWLSQLQGQNPQPSWLVRVNIEDFSYDAFEVPEEGGYGMTVTSEGYVWICGRSTRRFDPATTQWTSVPLLNGGVHTGGCMGDGNGILYRGAYAQIIGIDTQTLQVVRTLDVGQQGDDLIWGVAVDFDGFVWGVPRNGSRAYKVDAVNNQIVQTVNGLVGAYTYSDMTGFALVNVDPG